MIDLDILVWRIGFVDKFIKVIFNQLIVCRWEVTIESIATSDSRQTERKQYCYILKDLANFSSKNLGLGLLINCRNKTKSIVLNFTPKNYYCSQKQKYCSFVGVCVRACVRMCVHACVYVYNTYMHA